jgi:signal transduction histidine kinase
VSNKSGLGLGLAIVRPVVELHGGSVLAESPVEGLGATFTVRVPLRLAHPAVTQDEEPFLNQWNQKPW